MSSRLTFDTDTLLKLWDRNLRFHNLCILLKFFKKWSSPLYSSWIFSNFWHFSNLFWFFLTNTTENLIESQNIYKAISLQYWQFQDNRLVTETCHLSEQDETWNLQDRDWDLQKWSRDQVSRLHHCQ